MDQNDEFFDEYHEKYPDRAIGFSEYGADANPQYQSTSPEKGDYTESYQAVYHEHMVKMIEERPWLWATHVWNLFDFAADGRDEGGKHGENQKGLVTMDRKIKKDAFYLYKAAWNKKDPFVHLCGSRYVDRAEDVTEIKVYSNQSEVTLFVDGNKYDTKNGKMIFTFRLPISGEHQIEAKSDAASDTMIIRKAAEENPAYRMKKEKPVSNWFDADSYDESCYSVFDKMSEIRENPEAAAVIDQLMAQGAKSRGDVAEAVKDNPALIRMMGRMTVESLLNQADADPESIKQVNRILQGIKKA